MAIMRAVVVDPEAVSRLSVAEVEEPEPVPPEALVRISAVSLNRGEVRRAEASLGSGLAGLWQAPSNVLLRTARVRRRARGSVASYLLRRAGRARRCPDERAGRIARGCLLRGGSDSWLGQNRRMSLGTTSDRPRVEKSSSTWL